MDIKITVIMPVYNADKFLSKSIHSVINQTLNQSEYEIIIVDDCSTDNSLNLVKEISMFHKNIKIIENKINVGVSKSRNKGILAARGEYICFIDADDLMTKNALEDMYNLALKKNSDLIIANHKILENNSLKESYFQKKFPNTFFECKEVSLKYNPELLFNLYICSKLIKKDLLISENLFPLDIHYAEDQVTMINCLEKAKKIFILPKIIYIYRNDFENDSATNKAVLNPEKYFKSAIRAFNLVEKRYKADKKENSDYFVFTYLQRFLEGTVVFLFENILLTKNEESIKVFLEILYAWIEELENNYVLGSSSFEKVFFGNGEEYLKYVDTIENQQKYIELLRLIKRKKEDELRKSKLKVLESNKVIDNIEIILKEEFAAESIFHPKVTSFESNNEEKKFEISFETNEVSLTQMYKALIKKDQNERYRIISIEKNKEIKNTVSTAFLKEKKIIKILLMYRDYSGSNTVALFKNIPTYIKQNKKYEITLYRYKGINPDYFSEIQRNDIIITTNMELHAEKFGMNITEKIIIDLWHGFPLKNMFYKDKNFKNKNTISTYWKQYNFFISYSELYNNLLSSSLKVSKEKFHITGAPRNDLILSEKRNSLLKLSKVTNIDQVKLMENRIVFYVPTFRNGDSKLNELEKNENIFFFKEPFNLKKFNDFLSLEKIFFIVKLHPVYQKNIEPIISEFSNIIIITSENLMNEQIDFYELLNSSDALITDYSSIYFDYLLLNKPVIFNGSDKQEYLEERGFILDDYEYWTPGDKFESSEELLNLLSGINKKEDLYFSEREKIKNKVHSFIDDNSSDRVWNFVWKLIQ